VYEIRHPDAPDGFPQSNTTVIIGEKAVLVVDTCLLPSTARQDIEQIRQWTTKPVTYIVNTHWHFDHTLGNATYAEAFPGVQIVAQRSTGKTISAFNAGAMARYPARAERFRKILASGKGPDGRVLTDADRKDYEDAIAGLAPVVAEMKSTTQLNPNVIFDEKLDIDLGNHPVQIRHLGPGNTAGDTVIFLPNEKILAAGDLLDHPVPYFYGGIFAVEWVQTLLRIEQLAPETIVPGHGDVLHGTAYVRQVLDLLIAVNKETEKEINDGKTLEEIEAALPQAIDLPGWRAKFAGSSKDDQNAFDGSVAGLIKSAYYQIRMR
jgi:glyoxylase-like metal-dependent hydrolase (beta-lactamase superfamily II)